MQVHRLEDYRIRNRQGRSRGTGGYYVNRMGHKKETMVYSVYYETDAGEFSPEQWLEIMRECVAASGSEALLQRIIDHVKASCVWLKKDAEREEYALDILAGRIYRQGMRGATFRQRVSPKTQRMSLISRERVHDMREMRASLKGCREHPERLRTGMLQEDNATSAKENQSSQRRLQSCG